MTATAYLAPSAFDVREGPDLTLATALGRSSPASRPGPR